MTGNWTAIIVNYNGAGFIEACLHALENCTLRPADILVVDNDSTDDSLLELNGYPRAQVLAQERNLGFGGGANVGLASVETDYAVILNPDVEVEPSFGTALVQAFTANPNLGAAGALLIFPDGETIQHAGGEVNLPECTTFHHHHGERLDSVRLFPRDVGYVTGGAMALRMSAVQEVGGFDEQLSPAYFEDVDLCFTLRNAGWSIRFEPTLRALHHEGSTLKRSPAYFQFMYRNRLLFARKHLSAHDWATGFVPAELKRLRYELNNLEEADGLTIAGANAIESLARSVEVWDGPAVLDQDVYDQATHALAEVRQHWDTSRKPLNTRNPLLRLAGKLDNAFGPRRYLDAALGSQRAFNASVVRALEAQERVQREQLAATLLLAIDLIGRLQERSMPIPEPELPEM